METFPSGSLLQNTGKAPGRQQTNPQRVVPFISFRSCIHGQPDRVALCGTGLLNQYPHYTQMASQNNPAREKLGFNRYFARFAGVSLSVANTGNGTRRKYGPHKTLFTAVAGDDAERRIFL